MAELLFTVGYEGRSAKALATRLHEAQVARVLDVRASARSARPGFSKGPLAKALGAAGLAYAHLPEAGNPFFAEAEADLAGVLERYRAHLEAHPEIVRAVREAARGERTALLCAEANPARCHRSVLAAALVADDPDLRIVHL
ncbi:DUF488 domain-containing protein [Anaeromyxobacter oryzae]|uniref:DUF488 domain-containing protein n=1 Tax=Anaeromyxobacter oryzae TaxID=2918170 RepID=A0ABM7WRK9_9BACT|nr:DUF488 domain-containing protein [Anaeromyxobacter oryzae]BDG02102.1 hypothetical protein AMOR_10980 [Anaeromyxobacter oryzae]